MRKLEWIKWLRFWRLTTTWERKKFPKWNKWVYTYKEECLCDCWNIIYANKSDLKKWRTKSCWCLFKDFHIISWDSWTKFYNLWRWIKQRCNYKKNKEYNNYWWRWIKILWKDYWEFKQDMYDSYLKHVEEFWEKDTTIDRIDVNWDYCKENCRRATIHEQNNNKRTNKEVVYKWKKYISISILCEEIWIKGKYAALQSRLYKWQSVDYAVDQIIYLYYKNKNDNCN